MERNIKHLSQRKKIWSMMLAVTMVAGLLFGIPMAAKAGTYIIEVGEEYSVGDTISTNSEVYIKFGPNDNDICILTPNRLTKIKELVPEASSQSCLVELNNGLDIVQSEYTCIIIHTDNYMEAPPAVYVARGSGTLQDPYVFSAGNTPVHHHNFLEQWSHDDTYHWHVCTARGNSDACLNDPGAAKGEHVYGTEGDARFTCSVCGYVSETKKTEAQAADDKQKGKETEKNADGSSTVTEVKEISSEQAEITITNYGDNNQQLEQFIYEKNKDDEVALKKVDSPNSEKIVIPDTITSQGKSYKVTRLYKGFMKDCTNAVTLDIGKNVKTIDKKALDGGKKVKKVTIRGKLKKVGKGAFKAMKKGKIIIKGSSKTFKHNKQLIEKSGINKKVKIKK